MSRVMVDIDDLSEADAYLWLECNAVEPISPQDRSNPVEAVRKLMTADHFARFQSDDCFQVSL